MVSSELASEQLEPGPYPMESSSNMRDVYISTQKTMREAISAEKEIAKNSREMAKEAREIARDAAKLFTQLRAFSSFP